MAVGTVAINYKIKKEWRMIFRWPLGTIFHITSQFGKEIWVVSDNPDIENGVVGSDAPLGEALLASERRTNILYCTPTGLEIECIIDEVEIPGFSNFDGTPLDYWLKRYRYNPIGIRNDLQMMSVCLKCGNVNKLTSGGKQVCENRRCKNRWYVNNCWNCNEGRVDSRDPKVTQCKECNWYKCPICGSCNSWCKNT